MIMRVLVLTRADSRRNFPAPQLRVVEHNVLTVADYYSHITSQRLAALLDLAPDEVRPAA